jgi:aldehyde:ferredoxin oxidoreductase
MGSKNLKAVVFVGSNDLPVADAQDMEELGSEAYRELMMKPEYTFW